MKSLLLIKKKFKCAHCKNNVELIVGYTDGIVELCIEHALAELTKPEVPQTIIERYMDRITPKDVQ